MFKKYFWLVSIISFSFGLFVSSLLKLFFSFYYFIAFFIFLLFLLKKRKLVFLALFFFFLAFWRYSIVFDFDYKEEGIDNYYDQELKVMVQVVSDVERRFDRQRAEVRAFCAKNREGEIFDLKGKILLNANNYPEINYGDYLEINGKYIEPKVFDGFDYNLYLRKSGILAVIYYPDLKKIEKDSCNCLKKDRFFVVKNFIYNLKEKISEQFDSRLRFESSAILKAIILGDKSFLGDESREKFSRAGLSHIIAISGMHISVLSSLFLSFLLFLGLSRKKSFYFSILFLALYLVLIGAPASACRASLMGGLSFLAIYMGRAGNVVNALYFSAIFLLLINPLLLSADVGFQLSFLSVLAIIYIHPVVKDFLISKVFRKMKFNEAGLDIFSISFSVQIILAPILIFNFEKFSLIAPLSNLLVVWLLPILISLALIALFLSFFITFFSEIIYLIIDLIIKYILFISDVCSSFPGAFIELSNWSMFSIIIYYLILFFLFCFFGKIKKTASKLFF
jgi:competence protein ComEC